MFRGLLQPTHLIIILAIVLIMFGPGKLPEIGGAVGKSIREFRKGSSNQDDSVTTTAASSESQEPSGSK